MSDSPIRAAVIGTGHFATATVTQAASMATLDLVAVADTDVEAATRAFRLAGVAEEAVSICDSRAAALRALERDQRVIVQDASLLMELPLAVIVEATGVPEAGARHALAAIERGKHVVMVNKETDAVVGPMLAHLARAAGLVYTPADGDQHGLLIGLVAWARTLGLEVLCAGKARDAEFVYDLGAGTVTCGRRAIALTEEPRRWLLPIEPGRATTGVAARQRALATLPQVGGFDLTELAIVANATALRADIETLHCPPLHTAEIPEVLCPQAGGGILHQRGVVDAVTALRQPHEAGLGGGVFLVVDCASDYSRHILHTKGLIANARGTAALIYRPYHLCGVETPTSILRAAQGVSTLDGNYRPHVDVVVRATRDLRAGEIVGDDHSPDWQALVRPAQRIGDDATLNDAPIPLHLASGQRLTGDLPAGTLLTAAALAEPRASTLWALRRRQDAHFLT